MTYFNNFPSYRKMCHKKRTIKEMEGNAGDYIFDVRP